MQTRHLTSHPLMATVMDTGNDLSPPEFGTNTPTKRTQNKPKVHCAPSSSALCTHKCTLVTTKVASGFREE